MTMIRYFLPFLLFLFITSCSGAVKLNYKPGQIPDTSKATKPLTILLKPYIDSRGDVAQNYVGKIESTITDMHGDKIIMEKDVAISVNEAIKTHLTSAGFTVTSPSSPPLEGGEGGGQADIIMSGEIKKFRLDIKGRDEIEIELESRLISGKTGKGIWEGEITEKEDRHAGVSGNSKKTINSYISKTLAKVINKTIIEINKNFGNAGTASAEETPIPEEAGRISIKTEPPRSKVYIGDVYYGLSPLTVDIEPIVYEITIRLEGFKEKKEKVSIRKGQKTELEINMEKE